MLDKETSSFSRKIRFTLSGGNAKLQLLASYLEHDDGETEIDPSDVEIPLGTNLLDGKPHHVLVTVKNVVRAGVYSGKLEFVTVPALSKVFVLDLKLKLRARPVVKPFVVSPSFQLTRCWNWTCKLDGLLPAALTGNRRRGALRQSNGYFRGGRG